MPESRVRAFPCKYQFETVTSEQVEAVHTHSLEVLERVGITTSDAKVLRVMADSGQKVDFENSRVRFDPAFVMDRVALAPAHYTLAARNPANDLPLDGMHCYLSTDGCPADVIDLDTGKRRPSTAQDLSDMTRLADYMPEIGVIWQSMSANDRPAPVRPIYETRTQWSATSKHIMQMTAVDPFNARGVLEMCEVVAGSKQALRERPIMSNFQCILSPLHWEEDPVETMLLLAEAGIPVGICSMPLAAATSPGTIAGTIMMANAEILSGIVILETMVPGAKTIYISYASAIDMITGQMNPAWGGQELLMESGCAAMGRKYGVPTVKSTMGTGAKSSDWQAGVQNAISAMTNMLFPGDLLTGIGSLHSDVVYSLAGLVLDCEIMEIVGDWVEGTGWTDEEFGVEAVEEVGPGGHFLGTSHTRAHMREFWRSKAMDHGTWEDWEEAGRPDPESRATEEVRRILAEHEPDPLPEGVAAELDRIVETYEHQAAEAG